MLYSDTLRSPSDPRPRAVPWRRAVVWLECATVMALLLPAVLFTAVVLHTRTLAVTDTQRRVERLARTAHEHALKVFETNEMLLARVEDLVRGLSTEEIRRRAVPLQAALDRMTAGLPQVHAVWLADGAGQLLASSRRSGDLFFEVSRRREGAGGGPAGRVVVAVSAEYFRGFYAEISPEGSGIVHTLLQRDGGVLARWPLDLAPGDALPAASPIRKAMSDGEAAGTLHSVSTVDGRSRIAAYRKVGKYPAYVHAGIDEETALADWRSDTLVLAGFVLPLAAILALATFTALRRTRQNIAMAERLQHEYLEREKVEAALHHSQKLEALGHLTGGVAHDFNNLLMVVSMNASILSRQSAGGPPPRALQAIEKAVQAGSKLTRQLVAFTRRQPLVPQPVDFAQRLEADGELLRTLLGSRVQVEARVAPGTPPVLLDPSELELALMNLAINARHAMPEGGKVTLDVRPAAPGAGPELVVLSFTDTGSGIAPEHLARVFEPFFTTKAVGVGTGLGLSQVQGLCVRAGGRVEIHSTPGAGTSVQLFFPAHAAAREGTPAPEAANDAVQDLDADVLLVEDNLEVAAATLALLQSLGCRPVHCDHPRAALALLEEGGAFDAVLSDVVMPGGMDGVEFARLLRERWPALPLLLMTGYAERIPEAERLRLAVLPKPVDAGVLARRLGELLAARPQPLSATGSC
ncbi:ATP-binding protein [Ramlibacter alkalitolerans]